MKKSTHELQTTLKIRTFHCRSRPIVIYFFKIQKWKKTPHHLTCQKTNCMEIQWEMLFRQIFHNFNIFIFFLSKSQKSHKDGIKFSKKASLLYMHIFKRSEKRKKKGLADKMQIGISQINKGITNLLKKVKDNSNVKYICVTLFQKYIDHRCFKSISKNVLPLLYTPLIL